MQITICVRMYILFVFSAIDLCANVMCPASDDCHEVGTCDSSDGECNDGDAKPDGTDCGDPDGNDVCTAGVCEPDTDPESDTDNDTDDDYAGDGWLPLGGLAQNEGFGVGDFTGVDLQSCGQSCDESEECLSFTFCGNGNCHLKDRRITSSTPVQDGEHTCNTYYQVSESGPEEPSEEIDTSTWPADFPACLEGALIFDYENDHCYQLLIGTSITQALRDESICGSYFELQDFEYDLGSSEASLTAYTDGDYCDLISDNRASSIEFIYASDSNTLTVEASEPHICQYSFIIIGNCYSTDNAGTDTGSNTDTNAYPDTDTDGWSSAA